MADIDAMKKRHCEERSSLSVRSYKRNKIASFLAMTTNHLNFVLKSSLKPVHIKIAAVE